jgi:polysaccharide biosynthesis protein PslG
VRLRGWLVAALSLVALCVALVGVVSDPLAQAASRPVAQAASHAVSLGIADPDLLGESASLQKSQLADMESNLHVTTVRIEANWEYVQYAGPTQFDWSQYDPLVKAIRADGMGIDFVIDGTASWASSSGALFAQPASAAQFAAWAADVAARYGSGGTTSYEIGNEPNSVEFWQPAPNPAAYTADLEAAYKAIKAVQPKESVVSGGLAPESNDGTDINAVTFLQDMYADGAKGSFDAVGYHPYSYPALPNTPESWSAWTQMSATTPSIRSVMAANGDSAKQVWITEVGWPTNETSNTGLAGTTAQSDEVSQVASFAGANSWVGPVYWYSYKDEGTDSTNDEDWFGLVTAAGAHKPAYTVFKGL